MKLNKKKFLKSLEVAVSVAKNRSTMPILSFLKIEAMDGQMTIHATDLDSHVQSRCECDGSLPAVCVPAQLLHGLAKSAGDEITITMEKERLRFVSNGSAMLSTLKVDEMPAFPQFNTPAIGLPCADLADGLDAVSWACSKESAVHGDRVSNVFVRIEPKAILCGAMNGKQMAYFSRGVICAETEFIVPMVYCKLISDALRLEGARLHVTPNRVVVISDALDVSAKRHDGPFCNMKTILQGNRKPCGEVEVAPLVTALESCQMVGADEKRFAKVYLLPAGGRMRVQCQSEANAYLTWLPFAFPERINIDAARLLESMSQFDGEKLKMEIGQNNCLIMESGDLTVVNATCIKDKDIEDQEFLAAISVTDEAHPDDPPPMDEPKVTNPDDYKNQPVDF